MADLYDRLNEAGFSRTYVREHILPDWWDDDLALQAENRRLAEMAISRTLKIPLASLLDKGASISPEGERVVRFKQWKDVEDGRLLPSVVVARRACELVLSAVDLPSVQLHSAEGLRSEILRSQRYVSLTPLVQFCWRSGIPVIHLTELPPGARRLDGLALMVSGRPCIALAGNQPSPAWLAWPLAHEMGHVAKRHLEVEDAIDVEMDFKAKSPAEREANAYAKTLIYGDVAGFKSNRVIDAPHLVDEAKELGKAHRIHPACVITNYGFNMKAYDVANAALKIYGVAKEGPESIRKELAESLDLSRLAPTDRHFLVTVTGLAER